MCASFGLSLVYLWICLSVCSERHHRLAKAHTHPPINPSHYLLPLFAATLNEKAGRGSSMQLTYT